MKIRIRNIGNAKGVVLPKRLLVQAELEGQTTAEVSVESGAIVLRKSVKSVRVGWAQAAEQVAAQCGDSPLMGEFAIEADAKLSWW